MKKGQIAHLDHDSSNNDLESLAFLCLPHHDQYDSRTSQSKNFMTAEVKGYRRELHEFLYLQLRRGIAVSSPVPGETDRPNFAV